MRRRGAPQLLRGLTAVGMTACVACAGVPLDTTRPIERSNGVYRQEGERLEPGDMLEKIQHLEACESDVDQAKGLGLGSVVMNSIGGGLLGWALAGELFPETRNDDRQVGLYVGAAALTAVSVGLSLGSGAKVSDSVDCYNESLAKKRPRRRTRRPPSDYSPPPEAPPSPASTDAVGTSTTSVDTSTTTRPVRRPLRKPLKPAD